MCIAGSPPLGVWSVSTSAFACVGQLEVDERAALRLESDDPLDAGACGRVATEAEGGASLGALHGQQRFAAEGADLGLARGHVIRAEGAGDHGATLDPEPGFKSRGHS